MRFSESDLERQMRVKGEWDQLWKGQKTGLEFEASFEEAITELELAGLGKSKLDLKLDYLTKVGASLAADILKDSRMWEMMMVPSQPGRWKLGRNATRCCWNLKP